MRLKVNGVMVRVVDRIEIEIDVARDGEDLINGMQIRCHGGSLTIRQGSAPRAALDLATDRTIFLAGKDHGAIFSTDDPLVRPAVIALADAGTLFPHRRPEQ